MEGKVRVVGKDAKIPSKAKDKKVAKREQEATFQQVPAAHNGPRDEDLG